MSKNTVGTDFLIQSVVITTDRDISTNNTQQIDVTTLVAELKLFETYNRLHVFGEIALTDQSGMLRALNPKGSERITITLSPAGVHNVTPITRTFIIRGTKLVQKSSFFVFDLIDEVGYVATTKVFSKSYTGNLINIINDICRGQLNKPITTLYNNVDSTRGETHIVIPYINTYTAINWLMDRCTTSSGSPYYVSPSLYNNTINVFNLDAALLSNPVNENNPFINGKRHQQYVTTTEIEGSEKAYSSIQSYIEKQTDSMHGLSLVGALGSQYSSVNLDTNLPTSFVNTGLNAVYTLKAKGIINSQDVVDNMFEINGENQAVIPHASIHDVYDDKTYIPAQSYAVNKDKSIMAQKLNNKSLKNMVIQKTLSITMPGILFATYKLVVGNKIKLQFETSEALTDSNTKAYDDKLSGNYIITNIAHTFTESQYTVTADVVKLTRD